VVCVVDFGIVVHQDGVIAQMQGGINFGLSAAMYGDITIKNGRVEQSNFHDDPVMRIQDSPRIQVEVVRSGEAPGGIGETATAGVGPAYVNALFSATGVRVRQLPATPEQLRLQRAV
jgi:isoquinoline 1-oxidoreductase beta subunit